MKDEADKLRQENQTLRAQIADFERLSAVLRAVCSTLQVDEILRRIIEEAIGLCQAYQGAIVLFDPVSAQSVKTLISKGQPGGDKLDHHLNNLLAGWVLDRKEKLLTNDLIATFGERLVKPRHRDIASVLSVPLALHGKTIGVINLIALRNEKQFGSREARLMEILAAPCAQFIANAKLHETVFAEASRLRQELQDKYAFHGIIGHSPKMQEVFAFLERIIPTEGRVIIEGESGTGKELIARVLHYNGPRQDGPYVAVDCGALPANLLESELFGYVKGAFTGASQDKKGLFEEADHGALFLDEIANMPLEVQSKFLRALQEGEIRPVGSTKTKKIDVRIIAAASRDLRVEVEAGNFRQDLFYRLNVVNIKLPALRERKEDVAILAQHFLNKLSAKYGKNIKGFKPETLAILEAHHWPGNVRELENVIERTVILTAQDLDYIPPELLPPEIRTRPLVSAETPQPPAETTAFSSEADLPNIKTRKASYQKNLLLKALEEHHWNQSAAAQALGIRESTLRYKLKKLGIK